MDRTDEKPSGPSNEQVVEQRLQLLLQQLPCMLWTTDLALIITSLDGAALQRVGLQRNQTVGLHLAQVSGKEAAPTVLAAHDLALTGSSATYLLTWTDRKYEARVEPLRSTSGEIVGTVGIAVDVTERSQAEEENRRLLTMLEAQRAHLAAVLERLPVGVVLAESSTGQITLFNARADKILKHPVRQAQSMEEYSDLYRGFRIHDGTPVASDEWPLSRALVSGEMASNEEIGILLADGTRAIFSVSAAPILNTEKQRVGAVAVFDDITKQTLEEAERRFLANVGVALARPSDERTILQATAHVAVQSGLAACALWSVDDTGALGELVYAMRTSEGEQEGHRAQGPVPSVETTRVLQGLVEAGKAVLLEGSLAEEIRNLVAQTPLLELLRNATTLGTALVPIVAWGRPQALALVVRGEHGDWTTPWSSWLSGALAQLVGASLESTRLLERSRKAIQVRDEFLSIASHELRTPLTALKIQVEVLKRLVDEAPAPPEGARLKRLAETLSRQGDRLSLLVGNLLDVARLGDGRWKGDWKLVDLSNVVRKAIEEQTASQEQSGSEIHVLLPSPVLGHWDVLGLHQVATNLLSNAIKYGRGRPIEMKVGTSPPWAILTVQDQGIGIEHEALDRIFGRFERGASARNYGGLGLGLFIVRQIVEAHQGRVCVTSDVGVGTTFEIKLPLPDASSPR